MWRHGDVLIKEVGNLPADAKERGGNVLVRGEMTGHSHRIKEAGAVQLYESNGTLYMRIKSECATLIHEEHSAITLPQGVYQVWQQREYTPQEIRRIRD